MKKTINLVFAIATLMIAGFAPVYSQTAPKATASNQIYINKKGEIHNHGGTLLGYISKDDIVRDAKGKKVYFIDREGNVIDANGTKLGKAAKNGFYYNAKGEQVLKVKDKDAELCEILDPAGHSLGTTHKNYKLHACAAHCLFLKEKATAHHNH